MKRLFNLGLLMVLTSLFSAKAQDGFIVRGTVSDDKGEPLFGVNVVETNEEDRFLKGTITDFNGGFQLELASGDAILKISYIGYKTQTILVKNQTNINVTLASDVVQIAGVDVVAQKKSDNNNLIPIDKRNSPSASVTLDLGDLEGEATSSVEEIMQGQMAGVDIQMVSGNPGAGAQITIRGLGTIGDANPLFVVDGVPQNLTAGDGFDFGSADVEDIGQLVSIPPQDIKSITVLKDAASTAVWGSQGANGVILIESDKGARGKTRFDYTYKFYYDWQPPSIPMLNGDEYTTLMLEQMFNRDLSVIPPEQLTGLGLVIGDKDYYNYHQNTDWVDEITRAGLSNEHYFKVSGGGEKTTYFASVSYLDREGTTLNTGFKRLANRINLDYRVSDKLRFSTNFVYSNSQKQDNPEVPKKANPGTNDYRNIREMAYLKAPNMAIYEHDIYGNKTGEYFNPISSYQGLGLYYFNPVALANLGTYDTEENKIEANFRLKYQVASHLNADVLISYQYLSSKKSGFVPTNAIGSSWLSAANNEAWEGDDDSRRVLGRFNLNYGNAFGANKEHSINGTAMFEVGQDNKANSFFRSYLSPSDQLQDPSSVAVVANNIQSGTLMTRQMGALLNGYYKYLDKYIFQLNARVDASTKFGKDQRFALFPSAGVSWRFGKESFIQNISWINEDSKLRASYGFSGNDKIGAYDRHALYGNPSGYPNQYIGDANKVIVPNQVQLDNVRWETRTTWNVGSDLYFFEKDKLDIMAEVYGSVTSDLLFKNYNIPRSSGFNTLKGFNGGEISNAGWEFQANIYPIKEKDNTLRINFNISRNRNHYNALPPNQRSTNNTNIQNKKFVQRVVLGQPVGSFYGFDYQGVYSTDQDAYARDANGNVIYDVNGNDPLYMSFEQGTSFYEGGDAKYRDVNYDGSIDILDVIYLGDSNPDFTGGFGAMYKWDRTGLTFNCQFQTRIGFDIINGTAMNTQGMNNLDNQSTAVLRRWRRPGMDYPNMLPRAYMGHQSNNLGSNRYVEDGSFLRLNSVSVVYKVNQEFVNKLHLRNLSFAANARKLFTLTNYSGQDPEVAQKGDIWWIGADNAKTPPPRTFSLSINIGF